MTLWLMKHPDKPHPVLVPPDQFKHYRELGYAPIADPKRTTATNDYQTKKGASK